MGLLPGKTAGHLEHSGICIQQSQSLHDQPSHDTLSGVRRARSPHHCWFGQRCSRRDWQGDQLDVLALTSIHSSAINAVQCFRTTVLQDGLLTNSSPSLTDSEAGHSSSEGSDSKFEGASASVTDTTSNKDVTKYTIISGGNDCKICLSTLTCTSTKKSSKSSLKSKKQGQKPSVAYSYNLPSGSVVSFDHGSKINWISLLYESIDHTTSPLVCVADQGPSITIYKVAHP